MSKSKTMSRWVRAVRTRIANLAAARRKRSAVITIENGRVTQGRKQQEYLDHGLLLAMGLNWNGTVRISRARNGAFAVGEDTWGDTYVSISKNDHYLDFVCRKGFRKFTGMEIRVGDRFDVVAIKTDIEPVAPAPAVFVAPELVEA